MAEKRFHRYEFQEGEDVKEFILHSGDPMFLVQVLFFHEEQEDDFKVELARLSGGDRPVHFFTVSEGEGDPMEDHYIFLVHEFWDPPPGEQELSRVLKEMETWWVDYLNRELIEMENLGTELLDIMEERKDGEEGLDKKDYLMSKMALTITQGMDNTNPTALWSWKEVVRCWENDERIEKEVLEEARGFAKVYMNL